MINPATAEAPVGTAPAETPDQPSNGGSPRGNAARKFTISGNVIAQTVANLPERSRNALQWVADFCITRNVSHTELAPRLKQANGEGYSPTSLYHALTGGRSAEQLENIVVAIEQFRAREEARPAAAASGFIETTTARKIFAVCRKAHARRRPVFVFADSQIGKTTAYEEYVRRENAKRPRSHFLVRVPTGGAASRFKAVLARALGVSEALRGDQLNQAIFDAISSDTFIIFDCVDECFDGEARKAGRAIDTLNFILEIWDRCKCGMVLSGTTLLRRGVLFCREKERLKQLWRRSIVPLQLPTRPSHTELAQFAAAYGLPAALEDPVQINVTRFDDDGKEQREQIVKAPFELQTEIVARDGLGRWVILLQDAADLAREKRRSITWGLVLHAWHQFEQQQMAGDGKDGAK